MQVLVQSPALPPIEIQLLSIESKIPAHSVLLAASWANAVPPAHGPTHVISHMQTWFASMGTLHVPEQVSSFPPILLHTLFKVAITLLHVSLVWTPVTAPDAPAQGSPHVKSHEHRSPSSAAGHVEVQVPA